MEDTLDMIAQGKQIWYELCNNCLNNNNLSKNIKTVEIKNENVIKLDEYHTYFVGRYGNGKYVNGEERNI